MRFDFYCPREWVSEKERKWYKKCRAIFLLWGWIACNSTRIKTKTERKWKIYRSRVFRLSSSDAHVCVIITANVFVKWKIHERMLYSSCVVHTLDKYIFSAALTWATMQCLFYTITKWKIQKIFFFLFSCFGERGMHFCLISSTLVRHDDLLGFVLSCLLAFFERDNFLQHF